MPVQRNTTPTSLEYPDHLTEAQGRAHLASSAVIQGCLMLSRLVDGAFGPVEAGALIQACTAAVERFRLGSDIDHTEALLMIEKISSTVFTKFSGNAAASADLAKSARAEKRHADADAHMRDMESFTRMAGELFRVTNLAMSRAHKIRKGTGGGRFHLIDDRNMTVTDAQ